MSKFKIRVMRDEDAEWPSGFDSWKPYSFNTRHSNYKDPSALGLSSSLNNQGVPDVEDNDELQEKLGKGFAFWLSYFEHGSCVWFLKSTQMRFPDFQWDGVSLAGLLVWSGSEDDMGATTYTGREEYAAAFLKEYTAWCNGEAYGYAIVNEDEEEVDSCWGFFDQDYMIEQAKDAVGGEKHNDFEIEYI